MFYNVIACAISIITPGILILVHGIQFLSWASCREVFDYFGRGDHKHTAQLIVDHIMRREINCELILAGRKFKFESGK